MPGIAAMTPVPTISVVPMVVSVSSVSAVSAPFFFSKSEGGYALADVLRNTLAAFLGATLLITAGISTTARPRPRSRESIKDFLSSSSKGSTRSKVLETTA